LELSYGSAQLKGNQMRLESLKKRVEVAYERRTSIPEIIVEKDTSLTFLYGKGEEWNLPNSFLKLRWYQQVVHDAVFKDKMRFVYLAWCRRLGKEVTSWSILIKYVSLHRCTGVMIYPDNKVGTRILWEGNMSSGTGSTDFMDFLPPVIDRNRDINQTVKRIDFPNGSQIWILGAENYNKLRGINPKIAVFSEYAFQDPMAYRTVRQVMVENNGTIVVQGTFDGKNHGHGLWEKVQGNPNWFTSFFKADTAKDEEGNLYISEKEIEMMREEGIPEYFIQQEYFMNTDGDEEKYCFSVALKHMRERDLIVERLWKPGHPVHTFWDIGVRDSNAIIIVQFIRGKANIVGYFESNGKTYEYDIDRIQEWRASRNLSLVKHVLPHDGKNRGKFNEGPVAIDAKEYISTKLGEPCDAVDRPKTEEFGLQMVRSYLPSCMIDAVECKRLIECLSQHKKEYDEINKCYKKVGGHDWTSHAVKAVQTMCIAIECNKINQPLNIEAFKYIRR